MLDIKQENQNYYDYWQIQKHKVKQVLKMKSNKKIVELDNIPIKVWKSPRDRCIKWFTKLFNK